MADTKTRQIDARGLSCPEPVMRTRNTIAGLAHGTVEVLVDSPTAVDNVARLARNMGWTVTAERRGEQSYSLVLKK
jgi:TusA-related sulfurtransferase